MKAFKLINIHGTESSFIEGEIPTSVHIQAHHFFAQEHIDRYELVPHPAPRFQFVITLKGKLKFTVSNGDSFIIEPGILLVAADLNGSGHSWEIIDGNEWQRIYIVPPEGADDCFNPLTDK